MTLQDYINDVLIKVPTAINLPQANIITAVNNARTELASTCNLGLTVVNNPLTAGQMSYPFIVNTTYTQIGVKNIWIYLGTDRYKIPRKTMGSYPIQNFQGYPTYYYLQNQTVYFYPIPADAYSSDWEILSIPSPFVNLTDTESYIPLAYRLPLEILVASYTAMLDNKVALAQEFKKSYEGMILKFNRGDM